MWSPSTRPWLSLATPQILVAGAEVPTRALNGKSSGSTVERFFAPFSESSQGILSPVRCAERCLERFKLGLSVDVCVESPGFFVVTSEHDALEVRVLAGVLEIILVVFVDCLALRAKTFVSLQENELSVDGDLDARPDLTPWRAGSPSRGLSAASWKLFLTSLLLAETELVWLVLWAPFFLLNSFSVLK